MTGTYVKYTCETVTKTNVQLFKYWETNTVCSNVDVASSILFEVPNICNDLSLFGSAASMRLENSNQLTVYTSSAACDSGATDLQLAYSSLTAGCVQDPYQVGNNDSATVLTTWGFPTVVASPVASTPTKFPTTSNSSNTTNTTSSPTTKSEGAQTSVGALVSAAALLATALLASLV